MTTNTNIADTEARRQRILDQHRRAHAGCYVCDPDNPHGLNLRCRPDGENRVVATFRPKPWMAGFQHQMHGGIVSALLDGAMTQCLFAHDQLAMTAVMHLRYRRPVPLDRELHVCAWIDRSEHARHQLRAELRDGEQLLADAEATFTSLSDSD